jgi:hypothetical protein
LVIEGSGSVSQTNGSGSGRPKKLWPTDPDSDPQHYFEKKKKNYIWRHCARYCFYTLVEGTTKLVLAFYVAEKTQVKIGHCLKEIRSRDE